MITDDEVMVSEDKAKEKSKFNFTWPFGKNKKVEEKQEENLPVNSEVIIE